MNARWLTSGIFGFSALVLAACGSTVGSGIAGIRDTETSSNYVATAAYLQGECGQSDSSSADTAGHYIAP
jgi:hypothetical protein